MSFIDDVQGRYTQLYPIVTIEPPESPISDWENAVENSVIKLSTNNISLYHIHSLHTTVYFQEAFHFKPLLLNIPSIKESIDIESRKFKISNVSLDISNIEYEGKRFSDILANTSLINWKVSIQFVSPSANKFSSIFQISGVDGITQSFYDAYTSETDHATYGNEEYRQQMTQMVYQGVIRRISHDDTKCKIELEDLTEQKAHRDLPQKEAPDGVEGYLGSGDDVPDRHKNKPIPMVYGEVDRSPCLLTGAWNPEFEFFQITKIIIDNRDIFSKEETTWSIGSKTIIETPVYLSEDVYTFNCANENNMSNDRTNFLSYDNHDPYIDLNVDTEIINSSNLGVARIRKLREPVKAIARYYGRGGDGNQSNRFTPAGGNDGSIFPPPQPPSAHIYDNNSNTYWLLLGYGKNIEGDYWTDTGAGEHNAYIYFSGLSGYENAEAAFVTLSFPVLGGDFDLQSKVFINYEIINQSDSFNLGLDVWLGETVPSYETSVIIDNNFIPLNSAQASPIVRLSPNDTIVNEDAYDSFNGGFDITNILDSFSIPMGVLNFGIPFHHDANLASHSGAEIKNFRIKDLVLYQEGQSSDLNTYDLFANVKGRVNKFDDHPITNPYSLAENILIVNPIDIIYDLVRRELGHEAVNVEDYLEARAEHTGWSFGFTITKTINSKKLIEDIAKSTKCFPKFRNDGTFGFNTIKDSYSAPSVLSPPDGSSDYEKATLIKAADVISYSFKKTKPEQIYKKVTVSYNKDYVQDSYLETMSWGGGDDPYYGIIESDSYLHFESDYIRDYTTAEKLAEFLYEHYRNDHLIFNLKLPLKYINLEIGDLIKFRELLDGMKAYGIDYRVMQIDTILADAYPLFMITSFTKNLDSVSIECMQLHKLDPDANMTDWYWPVQTEGQAFYFPDAEPPTILDEDIEQFVVTPPVIWSLVQGTPLDASEGAMNTTWIWNADYTSVEIMLPPALVIDGVNLPYPDYIISDYLTINVLGETYSNPTSASGNPPVWIGPFNADTQVSITYSVTSPYSGLVSSVLLLIDIDTANPIPTITATPDGAFPFLPIPEAEGFRFTHHLSVSELRPELGGYKDRFIDTTGNITPNQIYVDAENYLGENLGDSVVVGTIEQIDLLQAGVQPDLNVIYNEGSAGFGEIAEGGYSGSAYLDHDNNYVIPMIAYVHEDYSAWTGWNLRIANPQTFHGDVNEDGIINILDIVQTVSHILYTYGDPATPPTPVTEQGAIHADINEDDIVNVLDIIHLVSLVFEE